MEWRGEKGVSGVERRERGEWSGEKREKSTVKEQEEGKRSVDLIGRQGS